MNLKYWFFVILMTGWGRVIGNWYVAFTYNFFRAVGLE